MFETMRYMVINNNQVINQTVPQPSLKVHHMSCYGKLYGTWPNTQVCQDKSVLKHIYLEGFSFQAFQE